MNEQNIGTSLVFDHNGHPTRRYTPPQMELSCQEFYGSITGGFEQRPAEKISTLLDKEAIAIRFDRFTDGRPYTLAQRLKESGFAGEIHAVGDFNQELVHHMRRVGFTHFHLAGVEDRALSPAVVQPFGGHYQITAAERASRVDQTADTLFDMFAID